MAKIFLMPDAGDVVRIQLDPTIGDEKRKERYCLVLESSSSHLNLLIILPITADNGRRQSHLFVPIVDLNEAGLSKPSVIDCYQIRTISTLRLKKSKTGSLSVGKVDEKTLFEVRKRLANLLDIGEEHLLF